MCFGPRRSLIKHVFLVDILNKINFTVRTRISLHKISTTNTLKHFGLITLLRYPVCVGFYLSKL